MKYKVCKKCKLNKSIKHYYRASTCLDGLSGSCKQCAAQDNKEHYRKNKEKISFQGKLRYQAKREKTPPDKKFETRKVATYAHKQSAYAAAWNKRNKEKRKETLVVYKIKNHLKIKARRILNNKIRDGHIERQACEVCDAFPAEAHHSDYSKPLEVRWLCRKHHYSEHTGSK